MEEAVELVRQRGSSSKIGATEPASPVRCVRTPWKKNGARFGEMTQNVAWSIIRSHAPVRADGVIPFSGEVTFDSLEY